MVQLQAECARERCVCICSIFKVGYLSDKLFQQKIMKIIKIFACMYKH